jgi:chemotaxis protein methyltransferase CheR
MKAATFDHLASLLKERSGLIVTRDKYYLLDARLSPVARHYGKDDLDGLVSAMRTSSSEELIGKVVDAMTTNETSFFRDKNPFETLRNIIVPGLIARRNAQHALRIWSAACSTGQEPYSLAMMLHDQFPALRNWRVEIVATDISPTVLDRAREGIFSAFEVQRGLPVQLLVKHFEQVDQHWQVKPELRRMIDFRPLNLLGDVAALGRFDVILCRNVLIYFDLPTKTGVLNRMSAMLAPDGALLLGSSESVFGICNHLAEVAGLRGVYGPASDKAANQTFQPAPQARAAY